MQTISQPAFLKLEVSERKSALEALVFSSEEPLSSTQILSMLRKIEFQAADGYSISSNTDDESENEIFIPMEAELTSDYIEKLIYEINEELIETGRTFHIVNSGGGWQFALLSEFGSMLHKYFRIKVKKKLSQAALESLAVIAYKQPVSKPEIEQIRGVNSNEVVNSLIEKNLVKIAGRSEALGKPLLYATTQEFLRTFGINSIDELPKLKEFEEIAPPNKDDDEELVLNLLDKMPPSELSQEDDYGEAEDVETELQSFDEQQDNTDINESDDSSD
ncbi:MAG: SMC-Scp complex subunit ScpB [Candidatus Kapabacteria bacterium]|jgi:segregation and condensation protein B|nr:SMC-Scp complex subunit ScpB [Candidatus Kapabacteria bacterium]